MGDAVDSFPRYRLIDHTADMAFEVEAPSWPDLLAVATAALGAVILVIGNESLDEERAVEVTGADREDVLVAWLNEAVVCFEDEGFLAREARIDDAGATSARGVLRGRCIDPGREAPDRLIKAVTYHDLEVVEGGPGTPWRATVVLDL